MRHLLAGVLALVATSMGTGDEPPEPADSPLIDQGVFRGKWRIVFYHEGGKDLMTADAGGEMIGDSKYVYLCLDRDAGSRITFGHFRFDGSGRLPAVDLERGNQGATFGVYRREGDWIIWAFSKERRPTGFSQTDPGVSVVLLRRVKKNP